MRHQGKTSSDTERARREQLRVYRQTHGVAVYQELVLHYLPLVQKVLNRYRQAARAIEDLAQIGTIGLINAVRTFDPERGVKFETYAFHHISGEIRHHLRAGPGRVRTPRWVRRLYAELTVAVEQLQHQLGRTATLAEVAARMNMAEHGVLEILRAYHETRVLSLTESLQDLAIRQDLIIHQRYVSFQLPIEDRIVLMQAVEHLAALQRKVVYYLFYQDLTQSEVAKRLGISQRHVSRLLELALKRLAGPVRAAGIGPHPATEAEVRPSFG